MRTTAILRVTVVMLSILGGRARAQEGPRVAPYPDVRVNVLDHASTAAEGALNGYGRAFEGLGAGLHGLGAGLYWNSLAEINHQQAVRMVSEDRERRIAAANARRAQKKLEAQERTYARRAELLERRLEERSAASGLQKTLDASQGRVPWPNALQRPEFAGPVKVIDQMISNWVAADHALGQYEKTRMKRSIMEIEKGLNRHRDSMSADDVLVARDLFRKLTILVDDHASRMDAVAIAGTRAGTSSN